MTIREMTEQREAEYFSPYASFSKDTKGRERMEEPCDIRPAYQISDAVINGMVSQEYIQEITDKIFCALKSIVY